MKIKLLSDLHVEFLPYEVKWSEEDILILAGDISPNIYALITIVKEYLRSAPNYVQVLFVLGNHDYYGRTIEKTEDKWRNIKISRFNFLQNSSVVIQGMRFAGTTMWTDLNGGNDKDICRKNVRDFSAITNFTTRDFMTLHATSRDWLKEEVENSNEPVIVITHHLPSKRSIHEKYTTNQVTASFASNDLEDIIKHPSVVLWCHGHTHSSCDYEDNETQIMCNPRGHATIINNTLIVENNEFEDNYIIDLGGEGSEESEEDVSD
jgi:predicted phosphohydrolase